MGGSRDKGHGWILSKRKKLNKTLITGHLVSRSSKELEWEHRKSSDYHASDDAATSWRNIQMIWSPDEADDAIPRWRDNHMMRSPDDAIATWYDHISMQSPHDMIIPWRDHQMMHLSLGAIFAPDLQLNAVWNCGRREGGPIVRTGPGECGLVFNCISNICRRVLLHHTCP